MICFVVNYKEVDKIKKIKFRELFGIISPILINPSRNSISISLSKRFVLVQLIDKIVRKIEEDPYLNFISVLKNYKVLDKFLEVSISDLYKDRNKFYFSKFCRYDCW